MESSQDILGPMNDEISIILRHFTGVLNGIIFKNTGRGILHVCFILLALALSPKKKFNHLAVASVLNNPKKLKHENKYGSPNTVSSVSGKCGYMN